MRGTGGGVAVRFRPNTKSAGGGGGGGGGAVRFRPNTKSGMGGGVLHASGPIRKAGGGGTVRFRPDTKSGGVLSSASGPIQKAGKGEGLFSTRGGVTIYERGGCNLQTPPPGSASVNLCTVTLTFWQNVSGRLIFDRQN